MSNDTTSSQPQNEAYNRFDPEVYESLKYVRLWADS